MQVYAYECTYTHTYSRPNYFLEKLGQLDYGWSYFDIELEITVQREEHLKNLTEDLYLLTPKSLSNPNCMPGIM